MMLAGIPVDTPFRYDRTALSFAAGRDSVEIVKLLLDRGADPNKKDTFYGATPMNWAADKGSVAMIRAASFIVATQSPYADRPARHRAGGRRGLTSRTCARSSTP